MFQNEPILATASNSKTSEINSIKKKIDLFHNMVQ